MNARLAWIATVGVQALVLGALVAREERVLAHGERVVLDVRPVDPMDLLSGRYIQVPLAITTIDLTSIAPPEPPLQHGETVFVLLAPGEAFHEPVELARWPRGNSGPWARARVDEPPGTRELHLDFGVDRYYIPETGRDPSVAWNGGERPKVTVAARIAKNGQVRIEDLLVDGEPYADWNARPPD
jgi:uncharacterized membrane-anchored protein